MGIKVNPYIDIHSHILPGIDDGAENFFVSMKMLQTAWDNGTEKIILTPHNKPGRHNADSRKIVSLIGKLQEKMEEEGIGIELYPGNEFYYRSGLPEIIAQGNVCTLAGSDYVLVEFSPMDDYAYIRNGIYSLTMEGYRPILAHAERYVKICTGAERIEDLTKMGCYIQINTDSLRGRYGLGTRRFLKKILSERLVHFVATDAHDMGRRPPGMSECASRIGKRYGEDYMRELFYENPLHVIRNEYIV